MRRGFICLLTLCTGIAVVFGADSFISRLPAPRVNQETWVMVEVWPEVSAITLAAYFLDFSYHKNKALCEATKAVFDRDQDVRSKTLKKRFSSQRFCMALGDAVQQGYVEKEP